MRSTNNILSIFIPTCGRPQSLSFCIESIISQAAPYNPTIYISNNDAEDWLFEKVIERYQSMYPYIEAKSNSKNIGIDRNMLNGFTWPDSRYCLFLGDDDILLQGGLKCIFDCIEKEDYNFIILNSATIQSKNKKILIGKPRFIGEDEIFTDAKSCFVRCNSEMPYGTLVCKIEDYKYVNDKMKKYLGTFHLYTGMLWEMLACPDCINRVKIVKKICIGKNNRITKTYSDYLLEVLFIAIPKWYNILQEFYGKDAVNAKYQYLKKNLSFRQIRDYFSSCSSNKVMDYLTYFPFKYKFKVKIFLLIRRLYRFLLKL